MAKPPAPQAPQAQVGLSGTVTINHQILLPAGLFDLLTQISQGVTSMNAQVAAFKAQVDAALGAINASLDNVVADEAQLAHDIQALKDQIAAGASTLDAESQQALNDLVVAAQALSARTAAMAAAVPDSVEPTP